MKGEVQTMKKCITDDDTNKPELSQTLGVEPKHSMPVQVYTRVMFSHLGKVILLKIIKQRVININTSTTKYINTTKYMTVYTNTTTYINTTTITNTITNTNTNTKKRAPEGTRISILIKNGARKTNPFSTLHHFEELKLR